MQQKRTDPTWRIGSHLIKYFDAIVAEPLPERWVDLIKRLNGEEERKTRLESDDDHAARLGDRPASKNN